jgi:hypothetical protein
MGKGIASGVLWLTMKLYHTTPGSLVAEILNDGFADAGSVRLADQPPDRWANLNGQGCLLFDIPEKEISRFEFDELGTPGREFAVPAEVLNRYPILASRRGPRILGTRVHPRAPVTATRRRQWIALAALMILLAGGGYGIYSVTRGEEKSHHALRAAEPPGGQRQRPEPPSQPQAEPTGSMAVGSREHGRLVRGVVFPAAGTNHFTWDVDNKVSPNPRRRRYGTDYVVRSVLKAVKRYRRRNPSAPKVGIADLSRRHGGDFGGGRNPTHENGLVVAVLYPRSDGGETEPAIVEEVDQGLAQALLDEFAKAGATTVSLDSRLGLTLPRGLTQSASIEPRMHVGFPKRP